jgi:hypothetical protein
MNSVTIQFIYLLSLLFPQCIKLTQCYDMRPEISITVNVYSTLKMGIVYLIETFVTTSYISWRHNPGDNRED